MAFFKDFFKIETLGTDSDQVESGIMLMGIFFINIFPLIFGF